MIDTPRYLRGAECDNGFPSKDALRRLGTLTPAQLAPIEAGVRA